MATSRTTMISTVQVPLSIYLSILTTVLAAQMSSAVVTASPDEFHDALNTYSFLPLNEQFSHRNMEKEDHKPWGAVIGFSLLINLATLSGVLFLIPVLSRKARAWAKAACWNQAVPEQPQDNEANANASTKEGGIHLLDVIIPSFASGALLATSVFLVIPEALFLIQNHLTEHEDAAAHEGETEEEHDEHSGEFETGAIWRFGTALLSGFLIPFVFDAIFPHHNEHFAGDECEQIHDHPHEHGDDVEAEVPKLVPVAAVRKVNYSLAVSILLGDAFCNFCDGVFVGVALSLCDSGTAYTIIAITLYHEIAQELADYFLLTKHAGLKPVVALSLNFVSGLSTMLGGIVVLATSVSDLIVGVVLSVAAGVYLYIAACECLPRVSQVVETRGDRLVSIFTFIVGVVPIGLALLNHSHCEADGH